MVMGFAPRAALGKGEAMIASIVTPLRPADNIPAMLRKLADRIEAHPVANVFLIVEGDDADDEVLGYGRCDDPVRAAGMFIKAARDVLP